jgi:hypothetical protein
MTRPDPKRVLTAHRRKTAGEVRFIKDRSGDHNEWGWGTPGPSEREIQSDFVFNPRYLKPLALTLRSGLMALGHATSAHTRLVKIKSRNISPDGALGGKGYIAKIPEMRRQLMNVVEALSALTDTVYDEINAPHWNPAEDTLDPRDRDEVKEIVEDAEEIRENPEGWAAEQEEDMDDLEDDSQESPTGKTARLRTPLRNKFLQADTALGNLDRQVGLIRSLVASLREDAEEYETDGDFEDPGFVSVVEREVDALAKIAWDLHKKAADAAQAAERATHSRPRVASVVARYLEKADV